MPLFPLNVGLRNVKIGFVQFTQKIKFYPKYKSNNMKMKTTYKSKFPVCERNVMKLKNTKF